MSKHGHGGRRPGAGRKRKAVVSASPEEGLARRVALLTASGMTVAQVAVVVELPVDDLRQRFPRELSHGREIVTAEEMMRLDAASAKGKVAASKLILERIHGTGQPELPAKDDAGDKLTKSALRILNGGKA